MSWWRFVFVSLCVIYCVEGDDIDRGARKGGMLKLLREMVNQTNADTMTLPANASSIRENITDTFSCENRTYGYYADVDNDCQIFHVCLTSQSASGRNTTYRWSFICPNETIFNQEVLTCTRPRDSIPCEESPMFYDVNNDIGKTSNDTKDTKDKDKTTEQTTEKKERRKPVKKQNLVQQLVDEVKDVKDEDLEESLGEEMMPVVEEVTIDDGEEIEAEEINETGEEMKKEEPIVVDVDEEHVVKETSSRLFAERSMRRHRGGFRFKADV